jgi:ATP:ADP antiporter, AAA family
MKNRFLHFLGVEYGEESMVSLLLTQSVFLGLFYGAFDISAHSLFLAVFDETIMARAYVISGMAGIVLTSIYSYVQARMKFKNFAVVNLLFVTILTLILWLLLAGNPSKTIIFIVFVMMGPLNILAMLGFWGTTGRLFTLRQGKRLFGLVDAGQIIGIIISSYAIPLLLTFGFNTHNIILISCGAVLVASVLQYSLGRTSNLRGTDSVRRGSVKTALLLFRKDTYVLNMGLFIAVSVMTAFFIQYSFMAVTREQYPLEADMAKFLGLFTGSMMIFTLFLKTFLFSYLIRNYGLRVILLLSPILLVLFTGIAAAIGASMGYLPGMSGFMIFFLLLALSRLFSKSLKDSVETPSFKVIYQTLGESVRYDVQSIVDGTVNEIAALVSGLLLSGLGIIVMGSLIHFSWVLLIITFIWVYIGYRLYSEYRKSIVRTLEETAAHTHASEAASDTGPVSGHFHTSMMIRKNYLRYLKRAYTLPDTPFSNEILKSLNPSDGQAKELLDSIRAPQPATLLRMLRDNSIESKRAAILTIGKHQIVEMISDVCDALGREGLSCEADAAIDAFGTEASGELTRFLMKNSGNTVLSCQIMRIIGKNCFDGSEYLIYQMLWASSRSVRKLAAEILISHDYQVPPAERDKIHQLISEIVGEIVWYTGASTLLMKHNNPDLQEALNNDKQWWTDFLFKLLAITYDSNHIGKIRENIETATVESVNFALEMIDIVLDESIKARVSYCLDITSDEEKLKLLHQFYPVYLSGYSDLITEVINRDYNLTGLWAKALAVRSIREIDDKSDFEMTITALLFSPETILIEEAARIASAWEKEDVETILRRVPAENREIILAILEKKTTDIMFTVARVNFLRTLTPEIPENDLIKLAGILTVVGSDELSQISSYSRFVWPVSSQEASAAGAFIKAGASFKKTLDANEIYYQIGSEDLSNYLAVFDEFFGTITRMTDRIEING